MYRSTTSDYKPLSDYSFYKKSQIANERLSSGANYDYDLSRPNVRPKHVKTKQMLYPETSFMSWDKRSDRVSLKSSARLREKEDDAKRFLKTFETGEKEDYSKSLNGDPLYRKMFREQNDDEMLLGSVDDYLNKVKAIEIEYEDSHGFNEPIGRIRKLEDYSRGVIPKKLLIASKRSFLDKNLAKYP